MKKKQKRLNSKVEKSIDAITNQNERLAALSNKDDHKDNYKEIFEKLVKEWHDKVKELNDEINQNNLTYYFKGNTARNRLDDFNNDTELF